MNRNKHILVISNNCFSQSDSNGRTLGNLFVGWPKENIAQMCVIARDPNWDLCDNYYCIEDKSMLKAFIKGRKAVGRKLEEQFTDDHSSKNIVETKRTNVGNKTVSKVVLRELIWAGKRWNSKSFQKWVDDFNPNVLVLQFGDSFFMLDIAYHIATTRNIPLIIFNTEGYYFFPHNWHHISKWDNWIFPIYKRIYCKKVERVMGIAKHCIYLNDKLQEDYDKVFGKTSTVIYNSSSVKWSNTPLFANKNPRICYLGNLGLDRDSGIIDIGEVLYNINPEYKIDVYGRANEDVQKRFAKAVGVEYKGLVSYDKVKQVISESDILFHVETMKGYKERQLQYAFSTKIADSIASGRCFVIYAPNELACSKYINLHRCGWVASTKEELREKIQEIINDKEARVSILENAKRVAIKNHCLESNATKFQNILKNL